jgi:ADP-heptose:LPS heptosyltransferase
MQNKNYLEFTHDLAELPHEITQKFYATEEEKAWAKAEKKSIGGTVILWSLAGSAVHKTWPYLDNIIAKLMLQNKESKVVLVGDELCKLLEQGWENESRVIRKSGEWTIRQSLAFAQVADLVIGPETGILNAVGMEAMPKLIMLSHSTRENLTKYWKNTVAFEPKTSCYPCHMMHYNFDFCNKNEEIGVSQCQVDISPDEVWTALDRMLRKAA